MAVDYTVVFTIVGKYLKKLNNYYAYIGTANTDQTAIETVLVAQSVTRLVDGLDEVYDEFRNQYADQVQALIDRITKVLTDGPLVTDQFAFGSNPGIQAVLGRMIRDMSLNDKNVTVSAMTTGAITRTVANSEAGYLVLGTKLDGVSPPMSGAIAVPEYAGLTSLLYPDDETITLTCVQDSETGGQRGAERWNITGTGAGSLPYSPSGENLGSAGSINTADNQAANFGTNLGFESWSGSPAEPIGWTTGDGTPGTDFQAGSPALGDSTNSFQATHTDNDFGIYQDVSSSRFTRLKSYFMAVWAKKKTDVASDGTVTLNIADGVSLDVDVTITPTVSTIWTLFSIQFVAPAQMGADVRISLGGNVGSTNDSILIDQIVIVPAQYVAGIAMAVFGGHQKFLNQDSLSFRLQNDNAGKFQAGFRKMFRVALPTDATPTISDSLVA